MVIPITRDELGDMMRFQVKVRSEWVAVYSASPDQTIWPQVTWGWTPFEKRMDVRRIMPALDAIADRFLELKPEGGRFFIDAAGAYYKDDVAQLSLPPFVNFQYRC